MIGMATWSVFIPATVALALVPGPDLALIVSYSMARGVRSGVWCTAGIALAGLLQTALVAFGLGKLMQQAPALAELVRLGGALYLGWLGLGMLRAWKRNTWHGNSAGAAGNESAACLVARGLLNNLLNPKALLFFSLFLPQFVVADNGPATVQIAILGTALSLLVMGINIGIAWLAGSMRRALPRGGRFERHSNGVLGVVFLGLAARLAWMESR